MAIAAIVVTYFPNEMPLARLLRSIGNEVEQIYVIDNTPNGNQIWLTSRSSPMYSNDALFKSLKRFMHRCPWWMPDNNDDAPMRVINPDE
jgi:hypothetical protein